MHHRRLLGTTALRAPADAGSGGAAASGAGQQQQNNGGGASGAGADQNNSGGASAASGSGGGGTGSGGAAGGGSAGGPSSAGGGGQASGAGAGAGAAASGNAPYRPEGLPDHLAGKDDRETLDKVFKAFDGYRKNEGERGAVPDAPDKYKLEFGDKVKPYTANFAKDPLFADTLKIAHEAKISDKQLNAFLPKLMEHMVEKGLVAAPVDAQAELMKLAPASSANLDDAGKKTAAERRLRDNIAFVDGLGDQLLGDKKDDPAAAPLKGAIEWLAANVADNVHANILVEWMRGTAREVKPALDGGKPVGGATKESVHARINDPRNDPRSQQFDRAFAEETDRLSKQVFGN